MNGSGGAPIRASPASCSFAKSLDVLEESNSPSACLRGDLYLLGSRIAERLRPSRPCVRSQPLGQSVKDRQPLGTKSRIDRRNVGTPRGALPDRLRGGRESSDGGWQKWRRGRQDATRGSCACRRMAVRGQTGGQTIAIGRPPPPRLVQDSSSAYQRFRVLSHFRRQRDCICLALGSPGFCGAIRQSAASPRRPIRSEIQSLDRKGRPRRFRG